MTDVERMARIERLELAERTAEQTLNFARAMIEQAIGLTGSAPESLWLAHCAAQLADLSAQANLQAAIVAETERKPAAAN